MTLDKTVVIIVEGKTDKAFLECYLSHLKKRDNISSYQIEALGGKNKKAPVKSIIQKWEGKSLVTKKYVIVFDADMDIGKSRKEVTDMYTAIREELKNDDESAYKNVNENINVFLLPDNKNTGTLETLLCGIAPEKYKPIHECFENYKDCICKLNFNTPKNKELCLPNEKAKSYAYRDALGSKNPGTITENDSMFYNLDHEKLAPLKEFLLSL